MRTKRLVFLLSGALLVLMASGCATTKLENTWTGSRTIDQPARKIMVMAVHDNPPVRQILEGQFMRQLRKRGVEALASSKHFAVDDLLNNTDAVAAKLREWEVDAAIVLNLVDSAYALKERARTPDLNSLAPFYSTWHGYYRSAYMPTGAFAVPRAGYKEQVAVETNVYDLAPDEQLVWSGLTRTKLTEDSDDLLRVEEYITVVVSQMAKDGILP